MRLGVAHVQVAIGLGREAGADLGCIHLALLVVLRISRRAAPVATGVGAFFQVGFNDLAQEVGGFDHFCIFVVGVGGCAHIPPIVGRLATKGRHCGCCNLCHSIQAFTLCLTSWAYPRALSQQLQRLKGHRHMNLALTSMRQWATHGLAAFGRVGRCVNRQCTRRKCGNFRGYSCTGSTGLCDATTSTPAPCALLPPGSPPVAYYPPPAAIGYWGPPPHHHKKAYKQYAESTSAITSTTTAITTDD